MSSLRERQKEQRREAILVAAMNLFVSNGYTATKVEEIAAAAEVSAPTVFNYFGSKQAILFALVDRADCCAVSDIRSQMEPFDNAVDALCHLQIAIIKYELDALPISVWQELMSLCFNGSISQSMAQINTRLSKEIAGLLRELQARGMLSANFDPDAVADLLNDYCVLLFARFVHQEEPDLEAHAKRIRLVVELIFNGLRA
ncbi:MAG: TetR/AcrR family transcriptional regulator [Pseudomonas sp.]|nr:TetR/AcrR family transcriptional regulator [Pseudomonas sp.]